MNSALESFKKGEFVIVTDAPSRENEGDLVIAASKITQEHMAFLLQHTSGIVCVALPAGRLLQLNLPLLSQQNTSKYGTPFTIPVDAKHETTTGVSATDRIATIKKLIDPNATSGDFAKPGHVFPLRADPKGLKSREGHTEAGIALCKLTGLPEAAVLCELQNKDGSMMKGEQLQQFSQERNIPMLTIAELKQMEPESKSQSILKKFSESKAPTKWGDFVLHGFVDAYGKEHLALVKGTPKEGCLVRIHSECLTGDSLFSTRCDCGQQLGYSLKAIADAGEGILIYLRQEGRGTGLYNKLKAYEVQDTGKDTVEANQELGLAVDARGYELAAAILKKFNTHSVKLLTNNPEKVKGLEKQGITITRVPCEVVVLPTTKNYLATKKEKLGHLLCIEK
jgi:3,4-dihydroxy 2-butanone 4-phosphate synthase / GTP cyclohydrolase II